ncbi:MAG: hypothetical protein NC412_09925 [Roseburia sp.]|nr:hypothetical protein [Roseburia sp.]MCM1278983.1 hypothetical protein [Robinsoniella sp.]
MYRLEQWEEYVEGLSKKQMKKMLEIIIPQYRKQEKEIRKELMGAVERVLEAYETARKNEKKGKLKAIQFSYLNLSVLKGDFEIHIEAYDNNLYLNRYEVNGCWKANVVYDFYEEYVKFLIKKCEQNIKDFSYREKQELRKKAAFDFHMITIRIIAEHAAGIVDLEVFQRLDAEEQGIISFGGYRSESMPLCIWNLEGDEIG